MDQLGDFSGIFRVLGFLGLLGGIAFFINRFLSARKSVFLAKTSQGISISETKHLGNKQFLVVVEYGGEKLLLGISPQQIQCLSKISSPPDSTANPHEFS